MEPESSKRDDPMNEDVAEPIPLTTEEPVRRSWLKEELETVNNPPDNDEGSVDEEDTGDDTIIHGHNRIETAKQSEVQDTTSSGGGDMMAHLSREISDYYERIENETLQYESQADGCDDTWMDDPELIERTESNKYIPYDPTPPISKITSSNSIRDQSSEVHDKFLVFSTNPSVIEDVNRITTMQYYGAGKTGIIPLIYREERRPKVYLVACDLSDESVNALDWTLGSMMRDGDEIHIAIVSNRDDNPEIVKASGLNARSELIRISDAIVAKVRDVLDKMLLFNIKFVTHAMIGRVKDQLSNLMEEYDYTLVVCGSRGRSSIRRWFMGSVSTYLVHTAPVPVAVIRKQIIKKAKDQQPIASHSLSESVRSGQLHVDELG